MKYIFLLFLSIHTLVTQDLSQLPLEHFTQTMAMLAESTRALEGYSSLFLAVLKKNTDIINKILQQKRGVKKLIFNVEPNGLTPFELAVKTNNNIIVIQFCEEIKKRLPTRFSKNHYLRNDPYARIKLAHNVAIYQNAQAIESELFSLIQRIQYKR